MDGWMEHRVAEVGKVREREKRRYIRGAFAGDR